MFEVTAPPRFEKQSAPLAAAAKVRARKGLILVIDDDAAICEAMRSLLESWGHECNHSRLRRNDVGTYRRLRNPASPYHQRLPAAEGRKWYRGYQRLQSEFNHEIPAMLVTG